MPVGDLENILLAGYDAELLELADRIGKPVTHIVEPYAPKNTGAFKMVRSDREAVSDAIAKFVIIGIDDPYVKQRLLSLYAEGGISPLDLIGGDIGVGSSWKPGLVHQFHSVITTNCKLGTCVKINTGAIVMHDADIGDFVSIAPRATLLGRVTVENNAFIGANATILPDIKIGEGAVVGAGAVVTRDVAARTTVVGVPAKPMEKNDE